MIVILKIHENPIEYPNATNIIKPLVSISVKTYQHVDFISDCIDGILMQETNFNYEILLGEDDSDDGTREICIEYAKRYPDKIRLFLHHRSNVIYINGSPTGRFNSIYNYIKARGKYIALCEGDDCWTNPYKLQKQIDFLERNDDFAMTSHAVKTIYLGVEENHPFGKPKQITSFEDLIIMKHFIPTLSIVFRKKLIEDLPDWYQESWVGDIPLALLLTMYGKNYYFHEIMGLKRKHSSGISQSAERKNKEYKEFVNKSRLNLYLNLSKMNKKNKEIIKPLIINYYFIIYSDELKKGNLFKASKNFISPFLLSPILSLKFIFSRITKIKFTPNR